MNAGNQRFEKIRHSLPDGIVASSDSHVLRAYSQDLWPRKMIEIREQGPDPEPAMDLVLWPENAAQISDVARWAVRMDCALYPYGAGSGVCGATTADAGEPRPRVVVDLKRMNCVRSIDRKSMTAWVEAGIIGENLERHLNQEGLTLGHFPSSLYCSSLGGWLATRSAGQLSTKYGKIEDMVLSLECVFADGTVAETARAPRSAMGADWTQLLLGTEGTLCFFSAACVLVHPLPEKRVGLSFETPDIRTAMEFARMALQAGLRPAALRIYDPLETSLTLSRAVLKESGFGGGAAIVAQFEGGAAVTDAGAGELLRMAPLAGARRIGDQLAQHWWEHRYDISYKQQLIMSHGRMILDTFEVAATWDKLQAVYEAVKNVNIGFGIVLAHLSHFYHAGANIYFSIVAHAGLTPDVPARYDSIWSDVMRAAEGAGATLSHHHGVGRLRREWIMRERADWMKIFLKVKNGFDPENHLNPGKMGG
ncbi:MAG: hypothetical protein A2583_00410 [Bdellovibrionales bacterium RIFOXYD1_FULL_53_11]|nr:MAG: hypothetical protein A2583_00410 [Bdellovibrionales bacterium RIFOXYD1_FULL_53_11]